MYGGRGTFPPHSRKWFGFVSRTQMFGSVAAALRYNAMSGICAEIASRLLGIPLVNYFDDFAALLRAGLADRARLMFSRFRETLGFQLKPRNSLCGGSITFLGFLGTFPSPSTDGHLLVSLPEGKRAKWPSLIATYLKDGRLSRRCLGKLVGRLSFSQTCPCGKFERTQMRPLSEVPQKSV